MDTYHTDSDTKEFSRHMNKEERKKEKEELHEELLAENGNPSRRCRMR